MSSKRDLNISVVSRQAYTPPHLKNTISKNNPKEKKWDGSSTRESMNKTMHGYNGG